MAALLALGMLGTLAARADRVVLRDGTTRQGTVVARDENIVTLRIGDQGLSMTVRIPTKDIAEVYITPKNPPAGPTAGTGPAPATTAPRTSVGGNSITEPTNPSPAAKPLPAPQAVPGTEHFFREWFLLGMGMDAAHYDPEKLPADQAALWNSALADCAARNRPAELADLTTLATLPQIDLRLLNKLCYRHHGELLPNWLAEARWEQLPRTNHFGQFDLTTVTPLETPVLIGLLRAATPAALEPVKPYYPLPPSAADLPKAQRPHDPLADIRPATASALKEKAFFAAAIISAQLTLEPTMLRVNQTYLKQQLWNLRVVIARCAELEPVAQAAAAKAAADLQALKLKEEHDQQMAAQKARLEAQRQNSLVPQDFRKPPDQLH